MFCGVLYVLRSGCQWRMLPADFPKWRTRHEYFRIWSEKRGPTEESIIEASLKNSLARSASDLAVDSQGWPHAPHVPTANVSDQAGVLAAFEFHAATLSDGENVLVDGGYRGRPFARAVQEVCGAGVEVVKRSDVPRFTVIPKRSVAERSFTWLEKCRRLWKNCERHLNASLQMLVLAFIVLLLKRF